MNVNNAISSVIKGSSNIAKILFNSAVVWQKSQQPTIKDLELNAVRVELGKRYVNPNLSLANAGTYDTYWIEVPSDAQILELNASGVITSATGVRCAYTNDYTNDTAEELFQFGYNQSNPTIMVNKNYKYVAISIFKTSLPATFEFKIKSKIEIPDNYSRCEYLESTGTQYIDTGIMYQDKDINIALDVVSTKDYPTTTNEYGVGWYAGTILGVTNGKWSNMYSNYDMGVSCLKRIFLEMKYNPSSNQTIYYVYGKQKGTRASSYLKQYATLPFPLFAFSSKETLKIFDGCRIYDFSFKFEDEEIAHFVPCLDENDVPCMYDAVSKQTFYNQGTGEFKYDINILYLKLKHFVESFVNASTGVVAPNSSYPRAISSPLVLFEKGKTYKVTSNLSAIKTDDGVRFRIFGTDDTYKMSLGSSQITTNAYATFEALDDAGKANFYVAKDVKITPKQDFKCRIMYIDKNYISEFKLEEI